MSAKARRYDDPPHGEFGDVVCESLTVKNNNGGTISLSFDEHGQPSIEVSKDGKTNPVCITIDENGGMIIISGSDGFVRITCHVDKGGCGYVRAGTKEYRVLFPQIHPDEFV